jgi:hypothetical protein
MISESDLLSAYIHFDPPIYNKRAKKYQVYLLPCTGSILKGRLNGITLHRKLDKLFGKRVIIVEVPTVLIYDNRPEYAIQDFPIKDLTRETLQHRIKEAFEEESRRIQRTFPR